MAQAIWYYPQLPEKVASHSGPSGQPDAWSTKKFFITIYILTTGGCALILFLISFGLPKIPVSLINLPKKDYWLSLGRRKKTFEFLSQYFLWFASATLIFLLDMFQQSFQVHLGKAQSLPHPLLSLGLYTGFTVVWSIGMVIKFKKKDESQK